jgi:hypothetical protein
MKKWLKSLCFLLILTNTSQSHPYQYLCDTWILAWGEAEGRLTLRPDGSCTTEMVWVEWCGTWEVKDGCIYCDERDLFGKRQVTKYPLWAVSNQEYSARAFQGPTPYRLRNSEWFLLYKGQ